MGGAREGMMGNQVCLSTELFSADGSFCVKRDSSFLTFKKDHAQTFRF